MKTILFTLMITILTPIPARAISDNERVAVHAYQMCWIRMFKNLAQADADVEVAITITDGACVSELSAIAAIVGRDLAAMDQAVMERTAREGGF